MRYRTLGKAELQVSEIGFGGIPIQHVAQDDVDGIVARALDLGINFFDTARGYTDSEQKLGTAFKGKRDRVLIATKSLARTRAGITADIEKSLQTMSVDYIDLYQMHNVKDQNALQQVLSDDGALAGLMAAQQKGLIRHIGVTGHIKRILVELVKVEEIETVQFPFNPVETNEVRELLEAASEAGKGVIIMKPLAGGAFKKPSLSLRYILEQRVSVVIPGMDSITQVEENAAVSQQPALSLEERKVLEKEAADLGTAFCRRCEYCLPCQQGIDIPMVFLLDGYYQRYDLQDWAKIRYQEMLVKPDACQECGECEERCPYSLPIRRLLKDASARLERA